LLLVVLGLVVWRLRTVQARGGRDMVVRRVWSGPDADRFGSVSRDGRLLAYVDPGSGNLVVHSLQTGGAHQLTHKPLGASQGNAEIPLLSPDGRYVAYAWRGLGPNALHVIDTDGKNDRVILQSDEIPAIQTKDWTPDGQQVAAVFRHRDGNHSLGLVAVRDGAIRTLARLGQRIPVSAYVSPDGRYLAYDLPAESGPSRRNIYSMNLASGGVVALVDHPSNDLVLGWAPDGRSVLFASDRTGTVDAWAVPVAEGRAAAEPFLVRKDTGRVWPMGFTAAGAYYYGLQTGLSDVYEADVDQTGRVVGPARPVAPQGMGANRLPGWSHDGSRLAYVSQPAPMHRLSEVRLMIRTQGTDQVVRPDLWHVEGASWSADGRYILVSGSDQQYNAGVYRVDIATGAATALVQSADVTRVFKEAVLLADGETLLYRAQEWGAEPAPLTRRDGRGRETILALSVYRFSISPDGRRIAYSSFDEKSEFIRVMPLEGGASQELLRQARGGRIRSLAWMPNGKTLLFSRKGALWALPASGGEPQKLELSGEDLRDVRVHPSGRKIAFTAGVGRGELWVMENVLRR
jgi:Tol biopolymer transport system component